MAPGTGELNHPAAAQRAMTSALGHRRSDIGTFESATRAGNMIVWITGEAEPATVRLADGRNVSKHYDLTPLMISRQPLDELTALITRAPVPAGALTTWMAKKK
jgi:hypothetical protein